MNESIDGNYRIFQEDNKMTNKDKNNQEEIKVTERGNDTNETKNIILYRNGDKYFPPKRFVVNKRYIRTWDSFLEELTKSIQPRSGAIRDIITPFHGTRIRSLDDLTVNGKYVAVAKGEAIKLIDYTNVIDVTSPLQQSKKDSHRLKPLKTTTNHDMDKVESKVSQQLSSKGIVMNVYRNGDPFTRAIKVVLNHFEQKHMSILVRAIEDRVLLPSNKPIRRLYTMSGEIIRFAKDVEDGQYYVAAYNEPLQDIKYGQYLPVIRGGKVQSSRNKIKYINSSPTPVTHRNNIEGNQNNEATQRTERSSYNSDRVQKTTNNKQHKKTIIKEKNEKEDAAVKIQAAFRGFIIRKEIRNAQEKDTVMPKTNYQYVPKKDKPTQENHIRKDKPSQENYIRKNKPTQENHIKNGKHLKQTLQENSKKRKEDNQKQKDPINVKERRQVIENKSNHNNNNVINKDQPRKVEQNEYKSREQLAASKIQAGFRSSLLRKQLSTDIIQSNQNNLEDRNKIEKNKNVYDNENKEVTQKPNMNEINGNDYKDISAAKIQSGFQAYKTRKYMNAGEEIRQKEEAAIKIQYAYKSYKFKKQMNHEIKEKAALKIQASYRSFERRKIIDTELNARLHKKSSEQQSVEKNISALIIQAGYRGFRTRKELER